MPENKITAGMLTNKGLVLALRTGSYATMLMDGREKQEYLKELKEVDWDKKKAEKHVNIENLGFMVRGFGVTVGGDPEIFIRDKKSKMIIPAFLVFPKGKKEKIVGTPHHGVIQETGEIYSDGFALEFTTAAEQCLSWLMDSYRVQLNELDIRVKKKFPNGELYPADVMEIPEEIMMQAGENDVMLGCMPSKNAYGDVGELVVNGRGLPMRCTGSHIHIGSSGVTEENAPRIVKAMDAMVGLASVSLFGDEENHWRRRIYGLPGEYRIPKHGIEYRVVSGAMLKHPVRCHFLFDIARFAFQIGLGRVWEVIGAGSELEIKEAIRNSDQEAARKLIKKNKALWKMFLEKRYYPYGERSVDWLFDILIGEKKLKVGKLEKNWHLGQEGEVVDYNEKNPKNKWVWHSEGDNCSVAKAEVE